MKDPITKLIIGLYYHLSQACLLQVVAIMISLLLFIISVSFGQRNVLKDRTYIKLLLATPIPEEDSTVSGGKQYELTNHLGNVLATISDRRLQSAPPTTGTSGITADLLSAVDYYAFGMKMPGRNFSRGNYRFGFNGKENDDDIKSDGNEQNFGLRIYDVRLGKFLSVDPFIKKYPALAPYQFANNTPIRAIDLNGGEAKDTKGNNDKVKPVKDNDKTEKVKEVAASTKNAEPDKKIEISKTDNKADDKIIHKSLGDQGDQTNENKLYRVEDVLNDPAKINEVHNAEYLANYKDGNLRLDFTPVTDEKGNTATRKYQIGVVNADGTESIIAETISNSSGNINGDFQITQKGQRLFQTVTDVVPLQGENVSGGTIIKATTDWFGSPNWLKSK